jgi:hypothetical protein
MENEDPARETAEVTNHDGTIVEVDSNLVLELMRQQAAHIDRLEEHIARRDELQIGMQREISLLASAISGHQRILEASQPTPELGPPKPPPLMN